MGKTYRSGGLGFSRTVVRRGARWRWYAFSWGECFDSGEEPTKKAAERSAASAKDKLKEQIREVAPCFDIDADEMRRLRILPLARLPQGWHSELGTGDSLSLRSGNWYKGTVETKKIARRFDLAGGSLVSMA